MCWFYVWAFMFPYMEIANEHVKGKNHTVWRVLEKLLRLKSYTGTLETNRNNILNFILQFSNTQPNDPCI